MIIIGIRFSHIGQVQQKINNSVNFSRIAVSAKKLIYFHYIFLTVHTPIPMTLTQIYDRIEDLLEVIKQNSEDQDCIFKCEMEIASLEQIREEMEEG